MEDDVTLGEVYRLLQRTEERVCHIDDALDALPQRVESLEETRRRALTWTGRLALALLGLLGTAAAVLVPFFIG